MSLTGMLLKFSWTDHSGGETQFVVEAKPAATSEGTKLVTVAAGLTRMNLGLNEPDPY